MTRILISALVLLLAGGMAEAKVSKEVVAGVQKAIGCTVEADDITAKGEGYKADDVQCKDGQYDRLLDKALIPRKAKRTDGSSLIGGRQ